MKQAATRSGRVKNRERFDLSDHLLHFFRDVDVSTGDAPPIAEHLGWGNINEDVKWSALFMLRCAIRQCRLWATWSYRNSVRTIYGPSPAVCFTEMPLAAFLEAGEARRSRGEHMSQFALVFPRHQLFSLGSRPVIYGLDDCSASIPDGKDGGSRLLDPGTLPLREQYRYVTFNPSGFKPIDWTHEREWRWPYRGDLSAIEQRLKRFGILDDAREIPGLELSDSSLEGLGAVVETAKQASWVVHDILSLVDRQTVSKDHYAFILKAEELVDREKLRTPVEVRTAIEDALIDLNPYFSMTRKSANELASNFTANVLAIDAKYSDYENGEPGGVWLWLLDNTNPLTRALVATKRVHVTADGRYLANLPEFSSSRSLAQREQMVQELADNISKEYKGECGYFAVLGSNDPEQLPFYNSDHLDNRMYYNVSWAF